jgi:hypothetical protein
MRRLVFIALCSMCCVAGPAQADHNVLELVSTSGTAQPCPVSSCPATLLEASADGSKALFRTRQPLVEQDTDSADDVYEWHEGNIRRIAQGLTRARISEDGSRIIFSTASALLPEDTDGSFSDVYELTGSSLRVISAPPGGSSAAAAATEIAITADNSSVFFYTTETLAAEDTDSTEDIYERDGGVVKLVSAGLNREPPDYFPENREHVFEGSSDNGDRVFWSTPLQMTAGDLDDSSDVYERSGGQTTLITSPPGSPGTWWIDAPVCCILSSDGTVVAFRTGEKVLPENEPGGCLYDAESEPFECRDVYRYASGSYTLVSREGPNGPCQDPTFGLCHAYLMGMSDDGSRIVFKTKESYAPQDTSGWDIYEWHNGTITLLSVGPLRAARDVDSDDNLQVAVSGDARHVVFVTKAALTSDDTDASYDAYERFNGTTRLLTPQLPGQTNSPKPLSIDVSDDGSAILITTGAVLVPEDRNSSGADAYDVGGADPFWLTTGFVPFAQGGQVPAGTSTGLMEHPTARAVSEDGDRVFVTSPSGLVPADTDSDTDIYLRRTPATTRYPRPRSAVSIDVPLVPAAKACLAPNREHGPPLSFGSCSPPAPASPNLTLGTGGVGQSSGRVRLDVGGVPGGVDDMDVRVGFVLTNVLTVPSLSDYTGELRAEVNMRLTDRVAGVPSTTDFTFGFTVPCQATPDTSLGGDCRLVTTMDALVPGTAAEGTRAVWGLDQIKVLDAGADGVAGTAGDNSLVAVQGIFVP